MSEYLKKTLSVLLTNFFILLLTIISGILIARYLGPSGKGILAMVMLIATILKLFGGLGVEFANVYFASRNRSNLPKIFSNNIFVWFLSCLFFITVIFLLKDFILEKFLPNFEPSIFNFAVIIFPFVLWLSFGQSLFQGLERFKQYNLLKLMVPATKLIAIIILVLVLNKGLNGGVLALTFSNIAPAIISIVFLLHLTRPSFSFDRILLKKSIKYGIKGQLGLLFQFFNYRVDMFFVNYFLGISAVGFYSISVALAEVLWHIPNSIASTLFPRVSTKDKSAANKFTSRVSRSSIFVMLISAIVVVTIGAWLIPIVYGSQFGVSIRPLQILLPGVIALGLVKILTGHLQGQGKPQYGSIVTVCSLVLTLIFDFILIPTMGINGAALATTIAYTFSLILTIVFFIKESGLKLHEFLIPDFSDILTYLARISHAKKNK